jgi:hypothetical protein
MTTEFKALYANASAPILVTEFGIETDVIFDHWKALGPILLIDASITRFPVQPLSFVIEAAGISTE